MNPPVFYVRYKRGIMYVLRAQDTLLMAQKGARKVGRCLVVSAARPMTRTATDFAWDGDEWSGVSFYSGAETG